MYSECLCIFVKNRLFIFTCIIRRQSPKNHLSFEVGKLFIEYLLVPNMKVGPGINAKIKATLSVPSWKLRSGGGICHSL